jgi:hypothetical protein
MKTITKTVKEIIDGDYSPLPLSVIPNYMGINLVSVESITWTQREDNQLIDLKINFIPEKSKEEILAEDRDLRIDNLLNK